MRQNTCRLIASILIFGLMLAFVGCNGGTEPTDPSTIPTGNNQQTQGTTAPETSVPGTSAPETTVPETTVPATTVPETTAPETTVPETTAPPETTSPVTQPPETQPPVTQPTPTTPSVTEPAQVEYEYGNHYVRVLNYTPAQDEHGHTYWNEDGAGKYYHAAYSFDVDFKTITHEIWCSWNSLTQMAFRSSQTCPYVTDYKMTPDENYYFDRVTIHEGYTCGFEGHYCSSENDHNQMMAEMERGCRYCGQKDCASFYARGRDGFTTTDPTKCPMYNVESDPTIYCQYCGHKRFGKCSSGETGCTRVISKDMPCPDCGEIVYVGKCHHCVHP